MSNHIPGWILDAARDIAASWAMHDGKTIEAAAADIAGQIATHQPPNCTGCDRDKE
ncbi:MAG: hypothetical protein PHR28_09430 [candidate division Zixibacteria bacterium]|nr:hypothetical protein [candidate division Zixibacteria bacterium]